MGYFHQNAALLFWFNSRSFEMSQINVFGVLSDSVLKSLEIQKIGTSSI